MTFKEWWNNVSRMIDQPNWSKEQIAELTWKRSRMDYAFTIKEALNKLGKEIANGD